MFTIVTIKMFTFVILIITYMDYENVYNLYKEKTISGRYLNLEKLKPFFQSSGDKVDWKILGSSVQKKPIYGAAFGNGKIKILMWSQMHGNESTTTKGLADFMNFLNGNSKEAVEILTAYSFLIIPVLNPDGAEAYTRVNANEVDLNRDFQNLTQPESQLLMHTFEDFNPDYCFNLHDQRTIFGVANTGKPATVSFLAPSFNEERAFDEARLKSVEMIVKMYNSLKRFVPEQIGRFDDGFNLNCVGDTFQALKTPTVLIEAGHFPEDYDREKTRKYIFIVLLSAFRSSNENVIVNTVLSDYLRIPQNSPNFFDFVYRNVRINYEKSDLITNFAVQFREELIDDNVVFNGYIAKVGNLDAYFGHVDYDAESKKFSNDNLNIPKTDEIASFSIDNKVIFVNGMIKN